MTETTDEAQDWRDCSRCGGVTGIFSFDAETDGLYGPVWAIGAVYLDSNGHTVAFRGQLDPDTDVVTDPWVREHIVPVVDLPRFQTRHDLLNAFWSCWLDHQGFTIAVADCGAPVEAGLFRACIEIDRAGRQWKGPLPLHELATVLLLAGLDPVETNRREYAGRPDLVQHDPVADALAAGLCWQRAVEQIQAAR